MGCCVVDWGCAWPTGLPIMNAHAPPKIRPTTTNIHYIIPTPPKTPQKNNRRRWPRTRRSRRPCSSRPSPTTSSRGPTSASSTRSRTSARSRTVRGRFVSHVHTHIRMYVWVYCPMFDVEEASSSTVPTVAHRTHIIPQTKPPTVCLKGHATFQKIRAAGKPIVAAINGPALGGGLEVALYWCVNYFYCMMGRGRDLQSGSHRHGWGSADLAPQTHTDTDTHTRIHSFHKYKFSTPPPQRLPDRDVEPQDGAGAARGKLMNKPSSIR